MVLSLLFSNIPLYDVPPLVYFSICWWGFLLGHFNQVAKYEAAMDICITYFSCCFNVISDNFGL